MITRKIVTLFTLLSFIVTTLHIPFARAEEAGQKAEGAGGKVEKKAEDRGVVTIVGGGFRGDDEGWSIVRRTPVAGRVIVVSDKVGPEIDLTERNFYGMFQGETIYKSPLLMAVQVPVDGFKSATFVQLPDSVVGIKITYGIGDSLRSRLMRLRNKKTLNYVKDYVEHFDEINRGTYKINKNTPVDTTAAYPLYTDQQTTFQETVPFYHVFRRANVVVTRKDGQQVHGEVIPAFDGTSIMVETDVETQKIPKDDISKIRFTAGFKGSRMLSTAFKLAFSGALTGALIGALAAWQSNGDVGGTVLWASSILGAAGFVSGLWSGGRNPGDVSGEFTLGPVKDSPKKEKKEKKE